MVGVRGFEPPTPCSQGRCASPAALHPDESKIYNTERAGLQVLFVVTIAQNVLNALFAGAYDSPSLQIHL